MIGGYVFRLPWPGSVVLLKSPSAIALFSERNRLGVSVINLPLGWRLTVRDRR